MKVAMMTMRRREFIGAALEDDFAPFVFAAEDGALRDGLGGCAGIRL
jgi:hypothetical protein